jgi:SAM-dependent methyltransferase
MDKRNCFLCGTHEYEIVTIHEDADRTGTYVICKNCGLIYHNPVMSKEEFAEYYKKQYAGSYFESASMQEEIARDRLKHLKSFVQSMQGNALEIGCSIGAVLKQLSYEGFSVFGVEPSEEFVKKAKELFDIEVFNGVYDEFPPKNNYYSLVCMFHVLEHIVDPVPILQRIKKELTEDGLLYLVVPTFKKHQLSMVFKAIHPTVFSRTTLTILLQKTGYDICDIQVQANNIVAIAKPGKKYARIDTRSVKVKQVLDEVYMHLSERQKCIDMIVRKLSELDGELRGAIFGAGHTTIELANVFNLRRLNITHVYDSDPEKKGKCVLDYIIEHKDDIGQFQGDYIIIASYAYQEEICRELEFMEQKGMQLITLYDKSL